MSKTVDERVVEMRFDNSKFEKNVQTSMSTLDKLKQKLNLSSASKGLENINAAAKKVDMSGISNAIETIKAKFSALDVMAVTALANITNSAVNAGKRIVSALTIDPIKSGFEEYETQLNAVQTILANTQSEGTNVKIVNKALDELNTYADKTIYNFTEMTRNIGTFTAAGVKLQTSVDSIKGIANLAALSGSTSQQASTAMYQLSQAIASGTVKLMDWNSVVNAGMGGKVFQDALIRTSEHLQTGAKAAISAEGSFRDSLNTGWLTTEVLTQTLEQFSTAADTQKEYEAAVKKFVEQGYTQEEAKAIADMAQTAGQAATKVKTFTQLIDTLKEALGSGWAKTWQIIIGDFEEAKELWTSVSDVLSGFINKMSDARNALLESALGKGFSSLSERLSEAIKPAEKAMNAIEDTADAVSDLGNIVDEVILGKFGNSQERFNSLTEAGQNYYRVQNKVNETLGNSYRYTDEQIASQDKLLGSQGKVVDGIKEESKETTKLTDEKKNLIKKVASMTEEQMRSKGYTDEQIDAFKELGETADKLGMPLNEFIDNMDKITGRWLLINSFKNIGEGIIKTFKAIGEAWNETFDGISSDTLFNIIAAFHKLSTKINITDETAGKLKRTFKGLFAVLDIVTTIAGGGLKLAFKVLSAVLGAFDKDILDLTAGIGDLLVKFRDFLFENDLITGCFDTLASGIKMVIKSFKKLFDTITGIPKVQEFIESIKDVDLSEVGKNIISGLKNGLKDGITSIPQMLIEIGESILEAIKGVLGIHSPSTKMYDVGTNVVEGFINGITDGASKVFETLKEFGSGCLEAIKNIDWSTIFAGGASIGLLVTVNKLVGILDNFTAPLGGLGDLLSGAGEVMDESAKSISKILKNTAKVVKSFSKVLNAQAFKMKATAIKDLAIALGILAASAFLLAQLDTDKLKSAVGAMIVLSVVLVSLSVAMDKLSSASIDFDGKSKSFKVNGLKSGLIGLGAALILMAATAKILGSMDIDQYTQGMLGLVALIGMIMLVFAAFGTLVKGKSAQNIDKAGKMLRKMAVTLLLMVAAVKLIGMLNPTELKQGAGFVAAFLVFVALLSLIGMMPGKNISKLGSLMTKISLAMMLMVGVVKLIGKLSPDEMLKGAVFAYAFFVFVRNLVDITKVDKGQEFAKLGGLLLSISMSMMLMIGVVKLIGKLSPDEMLKGAVFAVAFLIFVKKLTEITKIGSEEQMAKVAGTILAMSVAIGLLAGVCILLSLINITALAKGVIAVVFLGAIMSVMIAATKNAKDVKGSILAMTVAIAVMAAAVVALSFIDPTKLAGATIALSILMGMFALIENQSKHINASMGSLAMMSIIVALLGGLLVGISAIPTEKALIAAGSLSLVLLSLAGAMFIISKTGDVSAKAVLSLAMMALVVSALAGLIQTLTNLSGEGLPAMAASLILLAGSLAAIAIAVNFMNGAVAGAAALTVVALALSVLLPVLQQLGSMSLIEVGTSLLMLAGTFGVIGLAGLLLGPVTPILLALSVAITLLGIGALSAGTGLYMFASALQLLAQTGPAGVQALTEAFNALIALIPTLITTLVTSLVSTFVTCIPMMVEGALTLITSLLTAIAEKLPVIVKAGFDIIMALLNGIKNNIGQITTTAVDIIINFINAISEKLPDIIQAGVDLVFAFIDGIADAFANNGERARESLINLGKSMLEGIKEFFGINSPSKVFKEIGGFLIDGLINGIGGMVSGAVSSVAKLGGKLVTTIGKKASSFLNKGKELAGKLKTGIEDKVSDIKKATKGLVEKAKDAIEDKKESFKECGKNLMDGLKNGIENAKEKVTSTVNDVADNVVSGFKSLLGINSPSRVFADFGRYIDEGLVQGIKKYASKVSDSTTYMGNKAVNGMAGAINQIRDLINGDIETQPTIRPVLDLSNVKSGVGSINSMIGDGRMVSLRSEVSSVNSMFDQNRQNGHNDEVVSAINKLNKSLNNLERPSYIVNGVTYDDGSNVSSAVESLVRAARIERRI